MDRWHVSQMRVGEEMRWAFYLNGERQRNVFEAQAGVDGYVNKHALNAAGTKYLVTLPNGERAAATEIVCGHVEIVDRQSFSGWLAIRWNVAAAWLIRRTWLDVPIFHPYREPAS